MGQDQRTVSVSQKLYDRLRDVSDARKTSMAAIVDEACESVPAPKIERDAAGNHRIVIGERKSLWVGFREIAVLGDYRACTEHFQDVFPVNEVFRIVRFD